MSLKLYLKGFIGTANIHVGKSCQGQALERILGGPYTIRHEINSIDTWPLRSRISALRSLT